MPKLLKNISGIVESNPQASINIMGVISALDIEDYVEIPTLIGFLQNYLKATSVTELFVEGLDAYRNPDNENHPILTHYGLLTKTEYQELIIDY